MIPMVSPFLTENVISEIASSFDLGYAKPTFSKVIISPSKSFKTSSLLPPFIDDLISNISFILFAQALAFAQSIIRLANYTSSTSICDI